MQNENNSDININSDTFKLYMHSLLSTVTNENPLSYFNSIYKSINPEAVDLAVAEAKKVLQKENKKNGNNADVFLSIGGDGINELFFNGVIAALLWLPHYLNDVVEIYKLDRNEVETCKKVLEKIKLPRVFDAYDVKNEEGDTVKVQPSNCRHYASFLAAITKWSTNVVTDAKYEGTPKSNMELVRFLSSTAINSFPTIPWCNFYIGSVKTKDLTKLTENLSKSFKFEDYMSTESVQLNQPRFVVAANNAPLIGITGHPLSQMYVGMNENNKVEWMSIFANNDEFNRICTEQGFVTDDVKNYVMGTTAEKHQQILKNSHSKYYNVANFVEKQHFLKLGFDKYHAFDRESASAEMM
jgi:hypothetical protein